MPRSDIHALLEAARRTEDTATVITLYGAYVERLLTDANAAECAGGAINQTGWSPEEYLEATAQEITDVLGEDREDEDSPLLSAEAVCFMLQALLEMCRAVQAGQKGCDVDARVRAFYDELCRHMKHRSLDESVHAAQIVRHIFSYSVQFADTFFREQIKSERQNWLLAKMLEETLRPF